MQKDTPVNGANAPDLLVYNSEIIHSRDEMLSLTDMWKAAGRPTDRGPSDWRKLPNTKGFVEHVEVTTGKSGSDLFVTQNGGRNPGTFAHWQVGLAYAKYLSPEFHMWCNTVVRDRMMSKTHDTHLPAGVMEMMRRTDGICRMLSHKVTEMEKVTAGLVATLSAQTTALAAITAVMQPPHPILVRHGKTAGEIWRAANFPLIKVTCWFGNRLKEQGCLMEGRAEIGGRTIRLFDPDKAEAWLRNGGRLLVEQKVAERRGQRLIHLVQPVSEAARTF